MFNEEHFNKIEKTYRSAIVKYCIKKVNNDHFAADEITNDVFVVLFRKWDTLDFSNIYAWLINVADKHIMRHYRKVKYDISIDDFRGKSLPDELVVHDHRPILEYVEVIMSSLNDEQKDMFAYRYIEGYTIKGIAQLTDHPYSTVWYKLREISEKARNAVAQSLEFGRL